MLEDCRPRKEREGSGVAIRGGKFNPSADANPKMQSPEGFTMPLYRGQPKGTMAFGDEPMLAVSGLVERQAMARGVEPLGKRKAPVFRALGARDEWNITFREATPEIFEGHVPFCFMVLEKP